MKKAIAISAIILLLILTSVGAQQMWVDSTKLNQEKGFFQVFSTIGISSCENTYYYSVTTDTCRQKYDCASDCSFCKTREVSMSYCDDQYNPEPTTSTATETETVTHEYECVWDDGVGREYVDYEFLNGVVQKGTNRRCDDGNCYQKTSDTIECKGVALDEVVEKCLDEEYYVRTFSSSGDSLQGRCDPGSICVQKSSIDIECVTSAVIDKCTGITDCLSSGSSPSIRIWENCNHYISEQCASGQVCVDTGLTDPNLVGYQCVDAPEIEKLPIGDPVKTCSDEGYTIVTQRTTTGVTITTYPCDETSYCVPGHGCVISNEQETFTDNDADGIFTSGDCWPDGSRVVSTTDCCSETTYNPEDGGLVICGINSNYESVTSTTDDEGNVFISGTSITPTIKTDSPGTNWTAIIVIILIAGLIILLMWRPWKK